METNSEIKSTIQEQMIESILKKYIQENNSSTVNSNSSITEFESQLKTLDTSSNILWKRPQNIYVYAIGYDFIIGTMPLAGLKVMDSFVNSKFDISL